MRLSLLAATAAMIAPLAITTPVFASHDGTITHPDTSGGAGPVVNRSDCQAAGGTFQTDRGTKTCTTKSTYTAIGDVVQKTSPYEYYYTRYIGTSQYVGTVEKTTVQSQTGAGEVTTTSSDETIATQVNKISCVRESYGYYYYGTTTTPVSHSECESRNLFLAG